MSLFRLPRGARVVFGIVTMSVLLAIAIDVAAQVTATPTPDAQKAEVLHGYMRLRAHEWLGGVLAGAAYYFGVPVWLLRAVYIVLLALGPVFESKWLRFISGLFALVYVVIWFCAPGTDVKLVDFIQRTGG